MSEQPATTSDRKTPSRWAPWWVYVLVILGANYARQLIMPFGTLPEWAVVLIAVAISVTLFVVITAVHRVTNHR